MDSFKIDKCYTIHKGFKGPKNALQSVIFSILLFAMLLPFVVSVPVLAANVTDAHYGGTIVILNSNSSAAKQNNVVNFTLSSEYLELHALIWANLSNTAILTSGGVDVAYMPARGNDTAWWVWVSAIDADASLNYRLYTGGGNMDSKICYFPGPGGMGVIDNSTMEPANNFSLNLSGFLDTSIAASVYMKLGALGFMLDGTGNITGVIYGSGYNTNQTMPTNGAGNETGSFSISGASTQWEAVQSNDAFSIYTTNTSYVNSSFSLQAFPIPEENILTINSINVTFTFRTSASGYAAACTPGLFLEGNTQMGTQVLYSGTAFINSTETISRPGGGNWTYSDLEDLQVYICAKSWAGPPYQAIVDRVIVTVNISYAPDAALVRANNVSSADYSLALWADTVNMGIDIDGVCVNSTSLSGASVPDTAYNWTFFEDSVMPYMEYAKLYVNGTLVGHWEWENNSTFVDKSGNGNNATPTFITDKTDEDIVAYLDRFSPISAAILTDYSVESGTSMLSSPPTDPGMYEEGNTNHIPFASIINGALDASETPQELFWIPVTIGLSALLGMIVYGFTGSLLTQAIVSAFIMFFFAASGGGVIPMWTPIMFIIEALAIVISRKQVSW